MAPVATREAPHVRAPGRLFELCFWTLCVACVAPLWLVRFPPLQDFPQHAATVRVLLDHAEPALRLRDAIAVDLTRTQYLAFYLAASVLAVPFGPVVACKLLLSAALIGVPLSLRALLSALRKDERLALFVLPLTYNAHVMLGFLNFVAAIPLALFALALAVRFRLERRLRDGVLLALALLVLFYMHVAPFALACVGVALIALARDLRQTLRALVPLVPGLVAAAYWSRYSPAGESTIALLQAALHRKSTPQAEFPSAYKTLREMPEWLTDVLPGRLDLALLGALGVLAIICVVYARDREAAHEDGERASLRLRLGVLPMIALCAAFLLPAQHGWIWPVAGRFPLLAAIFLPLLMPSMSVVRGFQMGLLVTALALVHVASIGSAFLRFERDEVRGFPAMLEAIPNGARVVGLMYRPRSRYVRQHPFMHFVAYSQAAHGGVVEFSFARLKQSPVRYVSPGGPPKVSTGLGWAPQKADPEKLSAYFEYAITRGSSEHELLLDLYYERVLEENTWALWRLRPQGGAASPVGSH